MKRKRKKKLIFIIIGSLIGFVIVINLYFLLAPQFGRKPDKERIQKIVRSSLYEEGKFINTEDKPVMLPKSIRKVIRQQFRRTPDRIPAVPLPSVKPVLPNHTPEDSLSVIWLGHSSVLIKIDGVTILIDPVFGKRASPFYIFGPKPFELSVPFSIEDLPVPDMILISHDHFDHLDYKTIKYIHPEVKSFLVPLGIRDHLERWGVDQNKIHEFDWWEEKKVLEGIQITATPAQHFSGRKGQDNSTLWCSWVIQGSRQRVFFSGDSGYEKHFREIGEKYGPFDLTLMESGAYGRYWPHIHMLPEESVKAHLDLNGKILLPVHWGKYNLAFHPWKEPIERIMAKAREEGVVITTPKIGEIVIPGKNLPTESWWSSNN